MAAQNYVECGGARLWTALDGNGPPLVLCHGGPGLWDYLGPLAELLSDYASVVCYDQRGCGRSSGAGPYTVARSIADLEALRRHFGWERWYVGGHSWGALLALNYALAHPQRCSGLLYLSGIGIDPGWHADYARERTLRFGAAGLDELERLRQRWEQTDAVEDEQAFCRLQWSIDFADKAQGARESERMLEQGLRINQEVHRQLWADAQDVCFGDAVAQQLDKLNLPALLVHGTLDPRPAWPIRVLNDLLPQSRLLLLEGSAHYPWLDQPDELREFVMEWLRQ